MLSSPSLHRIPSFVMIDQVHPLGPRSQVLASAP
jgi:hypothetical protein